MKRKKPPVEKESPGTIAGAKYRERCNGLSDAEREKLNDEFMKVYGIMHFANAGYKTGNLS